MSWRPGEDPVACVLRQLRELRWLAQYYDRIPTARCRCGHALSGHHRGGGPYDHCPCAVESCECWRFQEMSALHLRELEGGGYVTALPLWPRATLFPTWLLERDLPCVSANGQIVEVRVENGRAIYKLGEPSGERSTFPAELVDEEGPT